ncbi:hypothetical protein [Streptomyces sp. S186]
MTIKKLRTITATRQHGNTATRQHGNSEREVGEEAVGEEAVDMGFRR